LQNPTGTSQTVDKAAIFCNSNDTVIVTNMSGSGGTTIVGCWYQVLH
jgi:energy-coupling factor transporter ATP-binding protein EcfA2